MRASAAIRVAVLTGLLAASVPLAAAHEEDYEFEREDLRDILDEIADDEDLNLVYAPGLLTDLDGRPILVTARLEDVRPRAAILAIVAAAGLRAEIHGGNIVVVQPSPERLWAELVERYGPPGEPDPHHHD